MALHGHIGVSGHSNIFIAVLLTDYHQKLHFPVTTNLILGSMELLFAEGRLMPPLWWYQINFTRFICIQLTLIEDKLCLFWILAKKA